MSTGNSRFTLRKDLFAFAGTPKRRAEYRRKLKLKAKRRKK